MSQEQNEDKEEAERERFERECPHTLEGFKWQLIPPPNRDLAKSESFSVSGSGTVPELAHLRVPAYDMKSPQVIVYPFYDVTLDTPDFASNPAAMLMYINVLGDEVRYIQHENVLIKRNLKGIRFSADETNTDKFLVVFPGDTRGIEHTTYHNEYYRDDIIALLNLTTQPHFKGFDFEMLLLHEGLTSLRVGSRWNLSRARYLRLMNGRLLVYRTKDSKYPLDVLPLPGFRVQAVSSTKIKLRSETRKFVFTFPTKQEQEVWLRALQVSKHRAQIEWQQILHRTTNGFDEDNDKLSDSLQRKSVDNMQADIPDDLSPEPSSRADSRKHSVDRSKSEERSTTHNLGEEKDYHSRSRNPDAITTIDEEKHQDIPDGDLEVHVIKQGKENVVKDNRLLQHIFVYSLASMQGAAVHATLIHINLETKTAQYFFKEHTVMEKKLAGALVRADVDSDTTLLIHYAGDEAPIGHELMSGSYMKEMICLITIAAAVPFRRVYIPNFSVHTGSCEKRGRSRLFWKYRYLVMINGRLLIYRSSNSKAPLDAISLPGIHITPHKTNELAIEAPNHPVVLRFASGKERNVWLAGIIDSISRGQQDREQLAKQARELENGAPDGGQLTNLSLLRPPPLPKAVSHSLSSDSSTGAADANSPPQQMAPNSARRAVASPAESSRQRVPVSAPSSARRDNPSPHLSHNSSFDTNGGVASGASPRQAGQSDRRLGAQAHAQAAGANGHNRTHGQTSAAASDLYYPPPPPPSFSNGSNSAVSAVHDNDAETQRHEQKLHSPQGAAIPKNVVDGTLHQLHTLCLNLQQIKHGEGNGSHAPLSPQAAQSRKPQTPQSASNPSRSGQVPRSTSSSPPSLVASRKPSSNDDLDLSPDASPRQGANNVMSPTFASQQHSRRVGSPAARPSRLSNSVSQNNRPQAVRPTEAKSSRTGSRPHSDVAPNTDSPTPDVHSSVNEPLQDIVDDLLSFEVHVLPLDSAKDPYSIGSVQVTDSNITLLQLRKQIVEQLDSVPMEFVFIRNRVPVGSRQEASKTLSDVVDEGVIFIRDLTDVWLIEAQERVNLASKQPPKHPVKRSPK